MEQCGLVGVSVLKHQFPSKFITCTLCHNGMRHEKTRTAVKVRDSVMKFATAVGMISFCSEYIRVYIRRVQHFNRVCLHNRVSLGECEGSSFIQHDSITSLRECVL